MLRLAFAPSSASLALAFVSGCAATPAPTCPPGEPTSPVVFELDRGRAAERAAPIDAAALRAATTADDEPAGRCVAADVERDVLAVQALYYDRGFLDASIRVDPHLERGGTRVSLRVDEGPAYRVGAVRVGEPDAPADDPIAVPDELRTLGLEAGRPFRRDVASAKLAALRTLYRDAGYPDPEVEPVLSRDPARAVVDVVVDVRRGRRAIIERVELRGVPPARELDARRAIAIAEGDAFGETKLERARARLREAGLARAVDVVVDRGSAPDRRVLVFEITPAR